MNSERFLLAFIFLLLIGCGGDSEKPPITPPDQRDTTAPAAVTDLAISSTTDSTATLTWTAPGDDGDTGTASRYDIRYLHPPITAETWGAAYSAGSIPAPLPAGSASSFVVIGIAPGTTYHFALKTADEEFNWSSLSNVPATEIGPDATPPAHVRDLHAVATTDSSATLAWTAPGDNQDSGTASSYDIRLAGTYEGLGDNHWNSAIQVEGEPIPQPAGAAETAVVPGLEPGRTYFARLEAADERGNATRGNIAEFRTTDSDAEAADVHWLDVFGGAGPDNAVNALCSYEGALIAGGYFRTAGAVAAHGAARWDGATWQPMGEFRPGTISGPAALTELNGVLMAGGPFEWIVNEDQSVAYAMHLAEWRDGKWYALRSGWGSGEFGETCSAFQPFNGLVAVGGTVIEIGTTYDYIQFWAGTHWVYVGGGVDGPVNALALYGGDLIVAGSFYRTPVVPARSIVRYDGSGIQGWHPLDDGIQGVVRALVVFQDQLYAAGEFTFAGGHSVGGIARWNGVEWSRPGNSEDEWDHEYPKVFALAVYNGRLVAGGEYSERFHSCIATWDGTSWGTLGTGIGEEDQQPDDSVRALAVHDGKLFVGGRFSRAGDKASRNIACWSD